MAAAPGGAEIMGTENAPPHSPATRAKARGDALRSSSVPIAETKWHAISTEDTLQLQATSAEGISAEQAALRVRKFGRNQLTPQPKVSFLYRIYQQLNNILILILVVAAIVSGIFGEFAEVALICLVVVINVAIGLVQEGRAEARTRRLVLAAFLSPDQTVRIIAPFLGR